MTAVARYHIRNALLQKLPDDVFDDLARRLEPVDLPVDRRLVEPHRPIEHVVFIERGVASVMIGGNGGERLETRHVGREGLTGHSVLLGVGQAANTTIMQIAGHGYAVDTSHAQALLDHPAARFLLHRYVHTCELQVAHTALSIARYTLSQRLARQILMCHDRIDGNDVMLTHGCLAVMLGVLRASITDQLHLLEGHRAIRSTRGHIRILDRSLLIEIAGGCYGTPEDAYARLIADAPLPHGAPAHDAREHAATAF